MNLSEVTSIFSQALSAHLIVYPAPCLIKAIDQTKKKNNLIIDLDSYILRTKICSLFPSSLAPIDPKLNCRFMMNVDVFHQRYRQ